MTMRWVVDVARAGNGKCEVRSGLETSTKDRLCRLRSWERKVKIKNDEDVAAMWAEYSLSRAFSRQ